MNRWTAAHSLNVVDEPSVNRETPTETAAMSDLTKLRSVDKSTFSSSLETWKGMEWTILLRDDFGGVLSGMYTPGPALIEALNRLGAVFELTIGEKEEIARLELRDSARAQERLNELVRAKANLFYGTLIEHFKDELFPSIKKAINDLVSIVVDLMVKEFGGDLSAEQTGKKRRGPKPLFASKGECLMYITYAEKLIRERGDRVTLSAISREIMKLKGRNLDKAYRVLKKHMDKFQVRWTPEKGAASI